MTHLKQVVILNSDLEISKGKEISQACHASLRAFQKASKSEREDWDGSGGKKVVLETGEKDMRSRFQKAKDEGIPASLIKDAGLTEVEPGTLTSAGIGPAEENKIDSITGDLRLVK